MPKISLYRCSILMLILYAIIRGIVFRVRVPDCGVSRISNIGDVEEQDVILNYALNKDNEAGMVGESAFCIGDDKYGVESANIIAVVTPTGNLNQTEASLGQEFTVKKVIRGDDKISVGQTSYVYQYFGFQSLDGHIEFLNTLNLMNPNSDYLIFMDDSPLNEYQKESVYVLKSDEFGYIKTEQQDTVTLDENYKKYKFSDLKEYEFFSTSESITEVLNAARKELIEKYL